MNYRDKLKTVFELSVAVTSSCHHICCRLAADVGQGELLAVSKPYRRRWILRLISTVIPEHIR